MRVKSGRNGFRLITIYPWRTCGQRCVFCVQRARGHKARDMDWWLRLIRAMADVGVADMLLSGGEPLDRPGEALLLLEQARAVGLSPHLSTCGRAGEARRMADLAARLAAARVGINLAIHGTERIHDAVVGRPGAFVEAMASLRTMRAAGCRVFLGSVLTEPALCDGVADALVGIARGHGCEGICFAYPRAADGRWIGFDVYSDFVRRAARRAGDLPVQYDRDWSRVGTHPTRNGGLHLDVFEDGQVYACPSARAVAPPLARLESPEDLGVVSLLGRRSRAVPRRLCSRCEVCVESLPVRGLQAVAGS